MASFAPDFSEWEDVTDENGEIYFRQQQHFSPRYQQQYLRQNQQQYSRQNQQQYSRQNQQQYSRQNQQHYSRQNQQHYSRQNQHQYSRQNQQQFSSQNQQQFSRQIQHQYSRQNSKKISKWYHQPQHQQRFAQENHQRNSQQYQTNSSQRYQQQFPTQNQPFSRRYPKKHSQKYKQQFNAQHQQQCSPQKHKQLALQNQQQLALQIQQQLALHHQQQFSPQQFSLQYQQQLAPHIQQPSTTQSDEYLDLEHAICYDNFPSYWDLSMNNSDLTNEKNGSKRSLLQNVDDETRTAITTLFYETMDLSSVGIGKDAKGLNHHKAEVCSIKRIENPVVFQNYHSQKKEMVKLYDEKRRVYADIASLNGSKGKVLTSCKLDDTVKSDLNENINEFYLFHGTKPGAVNQIFTNGFDPAFAKNTAMLGKGIYAAEKASKADQYTDDRFNRTPPGTELTMFLTRMLMGNAFLCDHTHKYFKSRGSPKFIRPPCVTCLEDSCSSTGHVFHDSVLADGLWKYREFVVYEKCQAYPEYIITYKRL